MQVLSPRVDMADFFGRLEAPGRRVLMLDYDGTLAPFKIGPEQAAPYPGVVELLDALVAQRDTRVVIVSGRRADEVGGLLPLRGPLEIWGAHGWERRVPGSGVQQEVPSVAVRLALADAGARAADFTRHGARLERKPAGIALHWRGLPELSVERLKRLAEAAWRPLAASGVLQWLPFDGGIELRAPGANKQHAVKAVLSETARDSIIAYLGDDVTDEDAFQAVKGRGLAVLVRPTCRATAADVWIRPPLELLGFIRRWLHEEAAR